MTTRRISVWASGGLRRRGIRAGVCPYRSMRSERSRNRATASEIVASR